jgi:3-hydroxy-9,10-secoandrosta-1,3,5(10)-triene-9,17-dione monooxygenase reductase component
MPYDVLALPEPGTTARPTAAARPATAALPATLHDLTLRDLMREVAQPVAVVSGTAGNGDPRPLAMTVSSVTSVSLDPPLLLFCPSRQSRTWAALAPTGRFVLNVVADHQTEVAAWFGGVRPLAPGDRGSATAVRWTCVGGLPALADSAAAASCRVVAVHPGGDHDIVVAAVDEVVVAGSGKPLSYWRGTYASVSKGSSC